MIKKTIFLVTTGMLLSIATCTHAMDKKLENMTNDEQFAELLLEELGLLSDVVSAQDSESDNHDFANLTPLGLKALSTSEIMQVSFENIRTCIEKIISLEERAKYINEQDDYGDSLFHTLATHPCLQKSRKQRHTELSPDNNLYHYLHSQGGNRVLKNKNGMTPALLYGKFLLDKPKKIKKQTNQKK